MIQICFTPAVARRGLAVALAALLGAAVLGLPTPATAADGRYVRLPDGSVQYVRDRDLRDWRRWRDDERARERRWRREHRRTAPFDRGGNTGELGDGRRDWRYDDRDWWRGQRLDQPRDRRYRDYPADGG